MVLLARIDPFPLLFLTLAPGSFAQFGPQERIAPIFSPTDLEFVDLDDDGDLDLAVCSHFGDAVRIEENLGDGTFLSAASLQYPVGSTFRRPMELASLDVDCDGLIDLAAVGTTGLSWWRSNGDRTFGLEQSLFTLHGFTDILAADVTGDGADDLLVSSFSPAVVSLYVNLGGGTFAPSVVVAPGLSGPRGTAVGDLDADGTPDLVVCDQYGDELLWYRGLGGGAFGSPIPISTTIDGPAKVELADVDGDGTLDVITTFVTDRTVGVSLNSGGAFGPVQVIYNTPPGPFGLAVSDYDSDGDPDVAVADVVRNLAILYENLGGGAFGPQ
ncbi:MAG: VCBS repeat-containing protein, partial [Planctomycetota bacterium]